MKKILCVLSSLNVGGAETFLMKLYRNMDKTKYQFDFCVGGDEKGNYESEIESLGGRIWHVPMKSTGVMAFTRAFMRLLRREKYDAVFRLGDTWIAGYELWLAKFAGIKVRALRSCNANAPMGKMGALLHKYLRTWMMLAVNVKIAPSTEAATFTFGPAKVKKGKVHLLHNAIQYIDYAYCEKNRQEIRQEFGLKENKIILHIGRMTRQKNHEFLVDIFKQIHDELPDTVLMLVGTGELKETIEAQVSSLGINEQVIFTGIRKDVVKLLATADLFLLPSFYEGMPNTIIEAQASGLKCLVSDTVTKEANISGLVTYVSLQDKQSWVRQATELLNQTERIDTKAIFKENQYDIASICEQFKFLMFGDD